MAKHGRYNIVRRVADGGMAEIFLATQHGAGGLPEAGHPQADPQHHLRRPPVPQHVHRRGPHLDEPGAQQHRAGAGPGRRPGPLLPGAGAGRRLGPGTACCSARPRPACRCRASSASTSSPTSAAPSPTRTARPTGRQAAGHRSPRHQPAQHPAVRAGRGEADRLRHRQGDEQARADRHRRGQGEGRVHVARAGDGQADRRALGPVLAGHGPLSADGRGAPVRGADRSRDAAARAEGRLHAARGRGARSRARGRRDHQPRAQARRRPSATRAPTRCWPTSSTCCAPCSAPVGQTELKRWLAELSAHDGQPSILKATGAPHRAAAPAPARGELDGQDVVLSDSQEIQEDEIDAEARTSLAVVEAAGGGRMRMSRQRASRSPELRCPSRTTPRAEHGGTRQPGAGGAAGPRDRGAAGSTAQAQRRRLLQAVFVGALLVGGAWFGGKYYRTWFGGGGGERRRAGERRARRSKPSRRAASHAADKPAAGHDKPAPPSRRPRSTAGAAPRRAAPGRGQRERSRRGHGEPDERRPRSRRPRARRAAREAARPAAEPPSRSRESRTAIRRLRTERSGFLDRAVMAPAIPRPSSRPTRHRRSDSLPAPAPSEPPARHETPVIPRPPDPPRFGASGIARR